MEFQPGDILGYRIAFSMLKGLTPATATQLLALCGDERRFFELSDSQLAALAGFRNHIFDSNYRAEILERGKREADYVRRENIRTVFFNDNSYAPLLAQCDDAPLLLYTLGNYQPGEGLTLGIVGTRHATAYGVDATIRMVEELAGKCSRQICIVSGLAFGIDITAHTQALKCNLPTVGVLAHGLNTIYPAAHRNIAAKMVQANGALVTEYSSTDTIHRGNFLARNRIVAGLCNALLVVESAAKGGALVTASIAGLYNRDVFAIPGRTSDRYSCGCNTLISTNRAQLVTSATDIIDAMGWPVNDQTASLELPMAELSEPEQRIYDWICGHPDAQRHELSAAIPMGAATLSASLMELEFKNLIIKKPGGRYAPVK